MNADLPFLLNLLDEVRTGDYEAAVEDEPEQAAILLSVIREAISALRLADDGISRNMARHFDGPGPHEVPGVKPFEIRKGSQRTAWEHDAVKSEVLRQIALKVGDVPAITVAQVLTEWWNVCGFQWKTTGLKELGLDPDEYCQKTWGPPKVIFVA